jgi:hypothetical protein
MLKLLRALLPVFVLLCATSLSAVLLAAVHAPGMSA